MDLPYKDEPHTMGDGCYVINEDEDDDDDEEESTKVVKVGPSELEKRNKTKSENFSELIKTESRTGKLNREVVYLNIATMMAGDIFVSRSKEIKVLMSFNGVVFMITSPRLRNDSLVTSFCLSTSGEYTHSLPWPFHFRK